MSSPTRERLRVDGSSASRAAFALAGLLCAASAPVDAGPLAPGEVTIDLPAYAPSGPIDRVDERCSYRFSWSGIPVGEASITARTFVTERDAGDEAEMSHVEALAVDVVGRTNRLVDLLWTYRLEAHGLVRADPFGPDRYEARELENRTEKRTRMAFGGGGRVESLRSKGTVTRAYTFDAPNTRDMLATVVLVLNLEYRVGEALRLDTLTGTARYLVEVRVAERRAIDVAGARTDAYRLVISTDELTDPTAETKHRRTDLWISAERPRRLLRARSATFVGAITAELVGVQPLRPTSVTPGSCSDLDLRGRFP